MTTKQIAEAAGVSADTVIRKIAEIYPEKMGQGKRVALTQPEAIRIMGELRKKGFIELPQNAEVAVDRLTRLEAITERLVTIVLGLMPEIGQVKAISAPPIAPRDELRRIVSKAAHDSGDYSGTWGSLYQEIYYRLHINVRERAKNAGVQPIEILESEGLMDGAVAIAREIFGRTA